MVEEYIIILMGVGLKEHGWKESKLVKANISIGMEILKLWIFLKIEISGLNDICSLILYLTINIHLMHKF